MTAPIIIYEKSKGALLIRALDKAAVRSGFYHGQTLADARAIDPSLVALESDPAEEAENFKRLAEALMHYSPIVAIQASGEVFIDITGCQRLFGGERAILDDLKIRIQRIGYSVKSAIADTAGAAWALARYGNGGIIDNQTHKIAIAKLPVEALRLPVKLSNRLRQLGLKTIGQLYGMPRTPLTARFTRELLLRLGQALGTEAEPLVSIIPAPLYYAEQKVAEPISTIGAVKLAMEPLTKSLAEQLSKDAVGARCFDLALFRVDNQVLHVQINASSPARDSGHLMRLLENKFDDLHNDYDAGFGFELIRLSAFEVCPLSIKQRTSLGRDSDKETQQETLTEIKDRLSNRLGAESVCRIYFRDTHLPERASFFGAVMKSFDGQKYDYDRKERPVKLLPRPEQIDVIAEVPDAPPVQFNWRRVSYAVARSNGPERIADEWQRKAKTGMTRDYYRVETPDGRRYWLFREGLYKIETTTPRWFLHGFFA